MLTNPVKVWITFLYALIIIGIYYFVFPHGQVSDIKLPYLLVTIFFYLCYKAYYIGLEYDRVRFTFPWIISVFLVFLFLYCSIFFVSNGLPVFGSLFLFWSIVFFLAIPVFLHLILYTFWETLRKYVFQIDFPKIYNIMISFSLWYIVFFFWLSLLAVSNLYYKESILVLLWFFTIVSYREILHLYKDIVSTTFDFDNHNLSSKNPEEVYRPYLLSTEFLSIIVIGIIGSNCISIFRPFPIGWDDLGVYMNFPKMLAAVGWNIAFGQVYPWQLYTGIGFLFHSQTLAFFLNSFSAVTGFFVTYLGIKALLPQHKKTFFNIPLLAGAIFLSLPMIVFQVAKDMKLDVGLYTISFVTIPLICFFFFSHFELKQKQKYSLLFIIGLWVGLAFSIKLTSLLLISALMWVLAYGFLWYFWFLGYIFFYISVFSFLWLWSIMNVVFPSSGIIPLIVSVLSFIMWCLCLGFQFFSSRYSFSEIQKICISFWVFLWGIILMFSPWVVKNISEVPKWESLQIHHILWGYAKFFQPEYTLIYDEQILWEKQKSLQVDAIDNSGNVNNEDFGRYFWYEWGINNYLKLPWNLSMQVNQAGEYTDISYIFLALIPLCFLFLPYRKNLLQNSILGITFFSLVYFLPFSPGIYISNLFSFITLPLWYICIFMVYILGFSIFQYTFGNNKLDTTIKTLLYTLAFTTFYVFLWNISAFGVVWYGVVMYGCFLLLFSLSFWYLASYEVSDTDAIKSQKLLLSFLIFCIPSFYFFQSTIPYYLNNIKNSGFSEYKIGNYSENKWLFVSHPEYISILYALNIDDDKKTDFMISYKTRLLSILQEYALQQEVQDAVWGIQTATQYNDFIGNFLSISSTDQKVKDLQYALNILIEDFYESLINPNDEYMSQSNIYRIGTFMKYFIARNNERLLEDSLVTQFDTYFYDDNTDVTFSRMKKLGLDYILVDLNAATIDEDPRRDLTARYERLLSSLISPKLTLVDTDSICLKLAIAEKDPKTFLLYGGVNYETYLPERVITRGEKFSLCQDRIIELLRNPETDIQGKYNFLSQIQWFLVQNELNLDDEGVLRNIIGRFGTWYKVLMRIEK